MSSTQGKTNGARPEQGRTEGAKRAQILAAATERFGRDGYEETKWADIAADVGVGPTALYHYFDSKEHCLFVILGEAIADSHDRFERITAAEPDFVRALERVLADAFDLTPLDVQRLRVLVAESGLLGPPSTSPREEQARRSARGRTREIELAWATFLAQAMRHGALPEGDAKLLARAVLGLYNSIWHWYRPGGDLALAEVSDFFVTRCQALLGLAEP